MQTDKCDGLCLSCKSLKLDLKLKIPPPGYLFLFSGLMWLLSEHLPQATWLDTPWNRIGWLVMALSIIPATGAFSLLSHFGTTPDPFHPEKARKLLTSGVYKYSRNPMYLGLLLLLIGWAIFLGNMVALLFPPLFVWVITAHQIRWEEQALEKLFGEEYLDYKRKVRAWL